MNLRPTTIFTLLALLLVFSGISQGKLICLHEDVFGGNWQLCETSHGPSHHAGEACEEAVNPCLTHCESEPCVDLLLALSGLVHPTTKLLLPPLYFCPTLLHPGCLHPPARTLAKAPLPARGPPPAATALIVRNTTVFLL